MTAQTGTWCYKGTQEGHFNCLTGSHSPSVPLSSCLISFSAAMRKQPNLGKLERMEVQSAHSAGAGEPKNAVLASVRYLVCLVITQWKAKGQGHVCLRKRQNKDSLGLQQPTLQVINSVLQDWEFTPIRIPPPPLRACYTEDHISTLILKGTDYSKSMALPG